MQETRNGSDAFGAKKLQYKVLTDQVRVSPIVSCNGVTLELDVEVTIPDRDEKKKLKLEIDRTLSVLILSIRNH